jgi:phospholipid/cholesterol/gamma-HCH transport system substrate-binding protein
MRSRTVVNIAIFAAFGVVCLSLMGYLAFNIGLRVPGEPGYTVKADFGEATGLVTQDEVRVAGVKVGSVTDLGPSSGGTLVTMTIAANVKLRSDTRAVIRPKSLLGTQYVELIRDPHSSAPYLHDGGLIPRGQTGASVQIDDVLNNMDPQTRQAMSEALRELGVALNARSGDVNQEITNLDQAVTNLRPLAQLGDRRQAEIARILEDLDIIMRALADEQDALGTVIDSGDKVFAGIAARDADLGGAVTNANGFFGSLDTAFSTPGVTQADRQSLAAAPSTIQANQHTASLLNSNVDQLVPALLIGAVNYPTDQLTVTQQESIDLAAEWLSAFYQHDQLGNSFRITNISGDKTTPSSTQPSVGTPTLPKAPVPTPSATGPLCLLSGSC